jgi:hypothetical protein
MNESSGREHLRLVQKSLLRGQMRNTDGDSWGQAYGILATYFDGSTTVRILSQIRRYPCLVSPKALTDSV